MNKIIFLTTLYIACLLCNSLEYASQKRTAREIAGLPPSVPIPAQPVVVAAPATPKDTMTDEELDQWLAQQPEAEQKTEAAAPAAPALNKVPVAQVVNKEEEKKETSTKTQTKKPTATLQPVSSVTITKQPESNLPDWKGVLKQLNLLNPPLGDIKDKPQFMKTYAQPLGQAALYTDGAVTSFDDDKNKDFFTFFSNFINVSVDYNLYKDPEYNTVFNSKFGSNPALITKLLINFAILSTRSKSSLVRQNYQDAVIAIIQKWESRSP